MPLPSSTICQSEKTPLTKTLFAAKPLAVAALALALWAAPGTQGTNAAELAGNYAPWGMGIVVNFKPCAKNSDTVCGELAWAWRSAKDMKPMQGMAMIKGLRWNGEAWVGGTLTNPTDGRSYPCTVSRARRNAIRLSGCPSPYCGPKTWFPMKSVSGMSSIGSGIPVN
ncbi:MAG: DUF2147 domain-containing protein [Pseudomonadota bacterium]